MKKFFNNLLYWIEINLFLLFGHIWAFIPLAFNDTSTKFNNFINLIPYMLKGLSILIIGSFVFIILYKNKKEFNILIYTILQLITILLWISLYYNSLII